jgi:hypothetical protein
MRVALMISNVFPSGNFEISIDKIVDERPEVLEDENERPILTMPSFV